MTELSGAIRMSKRAKKGSWW